MTKKQKPPEGSIVVRDDRITVYLDRDKPMTRQQLAERIADLAIFLYCCRFGKEEMEESPVPEIETIRAFKDIQDGRLERPQTMEEHLQWLLDYHLDGHEQQQPERDKANPKTENNE